MAKEEAEALAQKLPELDEVESSDSEGEVGNSALPADSGDLKKLMNHIAKNANSNDTVDIKEFGGFMKKYMNRRAHQTNLATVGGGIMNEHIEDGLNIQKSRPGEEDTGRRVTAEEMMEGEDGQRLLSKRPRRAAYPESIDDLETKADERNRKRPGDKEGEIDDWVPPTGQSGDGKTSLNDKFGY